MIICLTGTLTTGKEVRDSSACAIASSGLLVLSDPGGKEEFGDAALKENKLRLVIDFHCQKGIGEGAK